MSLAIFQIYEDFLEKFDSFWLLNLILFTSGYRNIILAPLVQSYVINVTEP